MVTIRQCQLLKLLGQQKKTALKRLLYEQEQKFSILRCKQVLEQERSKGVIVKAQEEIHDVMRVFNRAMLMTKSATNENEKAIFETQQRLIVQKLRY